MIVEFSIPRLIAPAYGNTLFSWTAIISVVLVSMTVGYYVGGRISNSSRTPFLIVAFGLMSAIWTILIAVGGSIIVGMLSGLNLIVGPVVTSIIFALVPTFLNAAIVPMAISTFDEPSGSASGKCFSISTVGSITGVILTGYVLLPLLGVSGTLLTGSALFFLALVFFRPKALGVAGLSAIMAIAWWITSQAQSSDLLVDHSNGYHRIKIKELASEGEVSRYIYLDSTLEGVTQLGSVTSYLPGVTQLAADLSNIESALVIGGGAFATPRYLKKIFPNATVDVIELDPDVIKYGYEYMELDDQVNVYSGDGRNVLRSMDKKYDLIFNDAFRGFKNIPSHMTTIEFNKLVKSKLTAKGIYAVNVRGYPSDSYLAASLLKTLKNDFPYLSETGQNASNVITVASDFQLPFGNALTGNYDNGLLLTDNRSPTEMLIMADVIRKKLGTKHLN
ncbi:MAG: fused MFS/spermidine synthase [Granulosicoccus sp.]